MAAVTIVDLASALGLSKTTVSDALIGSGRVSEETRKRVADAAQAMGYVSNKAARSLRRRSMGAFGLYIPAYARALSFYMHFAFGAAAAAAAVGNDLTLHANDAKQFHVDGAIVIDAMDDDPVVARMLDASIPIVFAGPSGRALAPTLTVGTIEIDHARIVARVLDALASEGTRRPGYIGMEASRRPGWAAESQRAYDTWCARAGVTSHRVALTMNQREDELFRAVEQLVNGGDVDALVISPQGVAARVASMLPQFGKRLALKHEPGFHLASLAGDPVGELGSAQILAVDLEPKQFGQAAVELLHEITTNPQPGHAHRFYQPDFLAG
ncbi:LacI family DNA-binding transcriptional regulator [Burkholderia guangdongensis]|uniref:LacI family DNA-binding transcriptional regulator n=1 Tax=Burkholderia guangdongensis TaxID=1792500 RepID=UPI0015C9A3F7|nr:LacI family DNA-binding transcriptional regulator [Burkholderia guangdongensis]